MRNHSLLARAGLAALAVLLAIVLIVSPGASDRMQSSVLILLGAAALFILVPWEKLVSLKAVEVEIHPQPSTCAGGGGEP